MKKYNGSLEAEVTVKLNVRLGAVNFDSVGDVIHNDEIRKAAAAQVMTYLNDVVDHPFDVEDVELEVIMDEETEEAYDAAAMEAEGEYFERADRCDEVADELGIELARWACGPGSNGKYFDLINNDEIYREGVSTAVLEYKVYPSDTVLSVGVPVRDGKVSYRSLYVAGDEAIRLSGDHHHIFIEALESEMNGEKLVVQMRTGS